MSGCITILTFSIYPKLKKSLFFNKNLMCFIFAVIVEIYTLQTMTPLLQGKPQR